MVDEGYAANQILSQLHDMVIEQDLNDKQKSAIAEKMAVGLPTAQRVSKLGPPPPPGVPDRVSGGPFVQ